MITSIEYNTRCLNDGSNVEPIERISLKCRSENYHRCEVRDKVINTRNHDNLNTEGNFCLESISYQEFIRPVPLHVIEYQARRQASLRIPRSLETPEYSATYTGNGFIRRARIKGFIFVDIPIDLLEISQDDLSLERMDRLELIGGTEDPIWVSIHRDKGSETLVYSIMDGNNRAQYRFNHQLMTIPAFITGEDFKPLYQELKNRGLMIKSRWISILA